MGSLDQDPLTLSASELAIGFRNRRFSVEEVIRASLERIEYVQDRFNAFTQIYAEEGIEAARHADLKLACGTAAGPLFGVPVSVKDLTPTKGQLTTRGSKAFAGHCGAYDAVIVQRLKAAGAIVVAKTTTPEFAYSSFTQSPLWGVTRNPWNPACTPGGSSGGAAVSVVTGAVFLAEGTDMGGSVRIPASLSGCVGLKPSKGRIPMDITETVFDHISHFGPLARTVEDVVLFLRATEGADERDIQSQLNPLPIPDPLPSNVDGLRIAASPDLGFYDVDPIVARNLERSVTVLRDAGARVDWINLNWPASYAADWFDYWCVFLAAQYGHLLNCDPDLLDDELASMLKHGIRMDAVTIERGAMARTRQWRDMARMFETYDALICPTTARTAPLTTAKDADFETIDGNGRLNGLDMTAVFNNVAVCPAIAVPNWSLDDGLPTSVQIVGRRFDDPTVLRVAASLERQTSWPRWPTPAAPSLGDGLSK